MKIDPSNIEGYIEIPEDVLIEMVARDFTPGRVFEGREEELDEWAQSNGYVRVGDD